MTDNNNEATPSNPPLNELPDDYFTINLEDESVKVDTAIFRYTDPDISCCFNVEGARTPEETRDLIYQQCASLNSTRTQLLEDIDKLTLMKQQLQEITTEQINRIVNSNILERDVYNESFEQARREAINRISEDNPLYISTQFVDKLDNKCLLCDDPSACVCALCDNCCLCTGCLERVRITTGKCPNCQKELSIKLIRPHNNT